MKRIIIVSILFSILFSTPVFAIDEGYYSTISFAVRSIGGERVSYDDEKVKGDSTYTVVRQNTIDSLTDDNYRRRTYNRFQYVALPPYSEIDIGYYWYNNTPDIVNVETIRIPMSRQIQERGDATKMLYDIGFEEGVTITNSHYREGKYLDVEGVGLISSDVGDDARKGVVIATLTIKPPVEITEYQVEYLSEYTSEVIVHIRNNTEEYLENVEINYKGNIDFPVDLEPYQEVDLLVYKTCTLEGNSINCGYMRIKENDIKTYCTMYGGSWDNYNYPSDSITVFNMIDGEWISGAQVQPAVEAFCIQRIPYIYTTEEMIVYIEPEEPEITQEQYWQELLNIDILPITSCQFSSKLEKYLTLLKPSRVDNL